MVINLIGAMLFFRLVRKSGGHSLADGLAEEKT
jgi:hypothetical protein